MQEQYTAGSSLEHILKSGQSPLNQISRQVRPSYLAMHKVLPVQRDGQVVAKHFSAAAISRAWQL